jgi:site-specific DNA-methyltransferase (adenine-specific)/adenine-specific DNA-methyltransferase
MSRARLIPKKIAEEAIAYLERREPLPDDFENVLFARKREPALAYAAKEREADILADTMAVPLQATKTFGATSDGAWRNILTLGDNLQVLKTLLRMKKSGELCNADGEPGVRLCYIDPPFATRREFIGAGRGRAYQDKVVGAEFVEFLRKRLIFIRELMSDDGSLYVHLDEKKSHYIKVILDEVFGEDRFEREIIWRIGWVSGYKTQARNWIRNHDVLLFYRGGSRKIFNKEYLPYTEDYVRRGGAEPTGKGVPIEDTWNANPADKLDSIQIMSFSGEKTGFPTQKNENLIERIIKASTNEGDLVLDAFAGSGTTAAVAERLGRRWVAIDSSKLAVYVTQERLLRLEEEGGAPRGVAPFMVTSAGLYDYKLLRRLPWEMFRTFALDLFQCRDAPHSVGKVPLDGYVGLDHVVVFDFHKHRGAVLDEAYIDDLHAALGERVGRRFFIIAPAASVRFLQDYLERRSARHPVQYFVLRIPYSVIDKLHERGFTRLQQPASETAVNETIDSVGFDFIQPPTVKCAYRRRGGDLTVEIKRFEVESMTRGPDNPVGRDALAMVMVDRAYDDAVFDVDEIFYGEDLAKDKYRFTFSSNGPNSHIMLIYVDVYGNEHREVKALGDFKATTRKR